MSGGIPMKKLLIIFLGVMLMFALLSCGEMENFEVNFIVDGETDQIYGHLADSNCRRTAKNLQNKMKKQDNYKIDTVRERRERPYVFEYETSNS